MYVHGLAGDIARDQNGEIGMIAGDVVDALPDAFYHLPRLTRIRSEFTIAGSLSAIDIRVNLARLALSHAVYLELYS